MTESFQDWEDKLARTELARLKRKEELREVLEEFCGSAKKEQEQLLAQMANNMRHGVKPPDVSNVLLSKH